VLALQRSAGNAAVGRILQRITITDEDGVELREATTPELVAALAPAIRRLLARLPANLQAAFGRLPGEVQRRLLTLDEDVQAAILRMPPALLAVLLSQAAVPALTAPPGRPALPAPPERSLVAVGPVIDHRGGEQPWLPPGLLDYLLGRTPPLGIDLAALMSIRLPQPAAPLLLEAATPPARLHQPSGNDPLLEAGRDYLEAGGNESEVRWALQKCGGNAAWAKHVLGFLLEYTGTPLVEQAKLELERAHGDQRAAAVKLAAVKRMRDEQARRAADSAQARYDAEKADLDVAYETEAVPLRKAAQKRKGGKGRGPKRSQVKAPEKSPLEQLDEKYKTAGEGLEDTRQRREAEDARRHQAALLALTGRHDPEQVERLLNATAGDVHLLTRLGPALDEAGTESEVLARALVASGSAEKLAPRCRELLAAGEATPATAVIVAEFMFEVPVAEAQAWARRNGLRIRALDEEKHFIAANKKFAAIAVCALDHLGLSAAEDLVGVLHLGAPLTWCIENLSGADRKSALVLIRARPQDAVALQQVLQRNPAGGLKQKAIATLIDGVKQWGGKVYDPAHQHYVTTAALDDAGFATMLTLMATGHTVATATHHMAQTEVAVPQGVTVSGWVSLNQGGMVRYPMAFSKPGYETDQACLKHYEEMHRPAGPGGIVPDVPVARMQNYFADLVAGCDAAFEQYKLDKPKKNEVSNYRGRPTGRAEWRIKVKNTGAGPQVFHVDSHYETSYWRTHET